MKHTSSTAQRGPRLVQAFALATVLALGTSACGEGGSSDGDSSSAAPDAKKAAASSLEAGLEAHAEGDLTAAAAQYDKTLELDPGNKFAFYNLALIDAASGNYGLAEEKYRAALKSDPTYEPALFNLAILRTGPAPEEAISLYERAVQADPEAASAWLNLGLLLRASGKETEGTKAVLRAIAINPDLKDPAAGKAKG